MSELLEALRRPEFTPGARHFPALFELLGGEDDDAATLAERALLRAGETARRAATTRLEDEARVSASPTALRARLCRLLGRLGGDDARGVLVRRLADDDVRVRRAAVNALGRLGGPGVAEALVARWGAPPELDASEKRALAAALGKVGDESAAALLQGCSDDGDPELAKVLERAKLMLARTHGGGEATIDASRAPLAPRTVRLHCRIGLEHLLAEELRGISALRKVRPKSSGIVEAELIGPLKALLSSHLWIDVGFPLADRVSGADFGVADTVIDLLSSEEACDIFRDFTHGDWRFRIEWVGRGPRRAVTWRIAAGVAERGDKLVNSPRGAPWEARVTGNAGGRFTVELIARGLEDTRFSWRQADVPAASHPTVAAALARAADVRPVDRVWDPFVGSGSELIECARLAPEARLLGTDVDPRAVHVARRNLAAAGVEAELHVSDSLVYRPAEPPTLVICNPPMGMRVARGKARTLLEKFVGHAAQILPSGGRLVWASPDPEGTLRRAVDVGLRLETRIDFDMGGFTAQIQKLRKP